MHVSCAVLRAMVYHLNMLSEPNNALATGETKPEPSTKGISSFALKIVAIVAMTCNHAGYMYLSHLPLEARCVLIAVGGLTFPIMAFLLVEGYVHTSNLPRYALRLLVFALIAQVPYWFFLGHEGNVLFTLAAGLAILWVADNVEQSLLRATIILAIVFLSWFCDWGGVGPVLVLLFYTLRDKRWGIAAAMALPIGLGLQATLSKVASPLGYYNWSNLPYVLFYAVGCVGAIPLLMAYNGQRGRPLKWFFYIYYPAHIAVLGLIYLALYGTMPTLLFG